MMLNDILDCAGQYGLVVRGGFIVAERDDVPDIGGDAAKSLILFGNAGSSLWECFSASDEYLDGNPQPLDRWSERIGNQIADLFGGLALFPFGGPPYRPFLQWASKSESLRSSRLGMLIHPRYGLWHAYRFAVAFPTAPDGLTWGEARVEVKAEPDICAKCPDQPCLSHCPVDAFSGQYYDVERCYGYLDSDPRNSCLDQGCAARLACPEGLRFRYQPDHARFHITAFYASIAARLGQTDR